MVFNLVWLKLILNLCILGVLIIIYLFVSKCIFLCVVVCFFLLLFLWILVVFIKLVFVSELIKEDFLILEELSKISILFGFKLCFKVLKL